MYSSPLFDYITTYLPLLQTMSIYVCACMYMCVCIWVCVRISLCVHICVYVGVMLPVETHVRS